MERSPLRIRHYFSAQHFLGGAALARKAAEIEATDQRAPDHELISTHRAYVITSILSAVAFLEAGVNEVFANAHDGVRELPNPDSRELFGRMWNRGVPRTSRFSILEKHQIALDLYRAEPFDPGREPYQDVQLVVQLRNALVHYKPEWIEPDGYQVSGPHDFEKRLRGKFPENPVLLPIATAFFPDRVLGSGCAKWALASSLAFAEEFLSRLGIEEKISGAREFLDTGDWSAVA